MHGILEKWVKTDHNQIDKLESSSDFVFVSTKVTTNLNECQRCGKTVQLILKLSLPRSV